MSLDTDLQTKLASLAGSAPVQQNYASVDKAQPRVYYQRASGNTDLLLSAAGVATIETTYTVEVAGLNPDAVATIADTIAALAPTGMQGFRGTMGSTNVLGCFVEDASDDYQPRGLDLDDGYHIMAMNLRIIT